MQIHEKFNPKTITADEVVHLAQSGELRLLDVRAPVEFNHGHLPGSFNGPILNDAERHQVGIIYKEDGQNAAIALGHQLVEPVWEARVDSWKEYLSQGQTPVLTCWRGGLRSETAQQWLLEADFPVPRIEGGYKAVRAVLLKALAQPLKGIVVSGMTGTGKTKFLRSLAHPKMIDLEKLALHKGSAFGFISEQPAQQTFENALALCLHRTKGSGIFEDESRLIGKCVLPEPFYSQLSLLPRIVITEEFEERVENIVDEYILEAAAEHGQAALLQKLELAVLNLKNRLGGAATAEILETLRDAFVTKDLDLHRSWISTLLSSYYDRAYTFSAEKGHNQILFEGNAESCAEFLANNPDLVGPA